MGAYYFSRCTCCSRTVVMGTTRTPSCSRGPPRLLRGKNSPAQSGHSCMEPLALTRTPLRRDAVDIWKSAVATVRPDDLVRAALSDRALPMYDALRKGGRILVVGTGKA